MVDTVSTPAEAMVPTLMEFHSHNITGNGGSTRVPSARSQGMPSASAQCSRVGLSGNRLRNNFV